MRPVNSWVWMWFAFSTAVVLYDTSFVLLRPLSMPGNSLSHLYSAYELYIKIDVGYADLNNGLVLAQALMNIPEALVGGLALVCALFGSHRKSHLLALIYGTMVFWKTILYFGCDAVLGFPHQVGHNPLIYFGVLSTGLPWILFPALIMRSSFNALSLVDDSYSKKVA